MLISEYKRVLYFIISVVVITSFAAACRHKKTLGTMDNAAKNKQHYTCSMHPEIIRDEPGDCPICGMTLVMKVDIGEKLDSTELMHLVKPNDELTSSVPVTTIQYKREQVDIKAIGSVQNDTRQTGAISAKISGRIEKLYVRYRYQMIAPGQKIMDIYSPEVATAEQNLLFLLKNDPSNTTLIQAAKQRLLLIGMSTPQLDQLIKTGKPSLTISIYSNAMGHIHESGAEEMNANSMQSASTTVPLTIREGMYVTMGQRIFSLTDPHRSWVILDIFPENQYLIKVGNAVKLTPEAMPGKAFNARIDFIEPFYREGNKTLSARVYFDNSTLKIPIGSQVRASISGNSINANWLPREAVLSLGVNDIVFIKTGNSFAPRKIKAGVRHGNSVQVISGLSSADTVALNAQYLEDSESFIKVN